MTRKRNGVWKTRNGNEFERLTINVERICLINPRCRFASLQTPRICGHNKTEGLKAPGYLYSRLPDVFFLTTHRSLLITHHSSLTSHYSSLITHYSQHITRNSNAQSSTSREGLFEFREMQCVFKKWPHWPRDHTCTLPLGASSSCQSSIPT